tara:strand:+ start:182 stop:445 length:264 start_codon:yes stop_codon:yes gene_type:complete
LLVNFTFEVVRYTAREFDVFESSGNFASCVRYDFAMFAADNSREFIGSSSQELTEAKHDLGPLGKRTFGPLDRSGFGSCHGFVNFSY